MRRPSTAHVEAAKRLLASESASGDSAAERAAAAGRVYEGLFRSLAPVIGAAGVRALFARSVKLNTEGFPSLATIRVTAEPSESSAHIAQQLVACLSQLDPAAAFEVATGLYASLFGLMTQFIGEELVSQLVKSAFPVTDATGLKETS